MNEQHFQKIVDALVSLKDTSEIMLDLAYSSLLLNSRELAQEVQELEEHMDELHTEYELLVLSSGFKPEESKDFLGLIRLGVVTEQIADAAASLAEVVLRELEPHPVVKMAIEEAEETVTSAQVSEASPLNGKTLKEARVADETGMWVLVIKRGGKWIRPRPNTKIEAGDILIASGYAEGEEDFKKLASGEN
ncbi:PhoU family transcriptional regulator [Candidatus Bathyarchaeota archaeon ex4484_231]|nr:MAG: PhoU family transcriptional regulator [Candidatus Bathyarchaeota archaeon ex4484_231]RJS76295.1 MAG: PhoU family transcriptional regulator [Candidatus Bathyarchaeota archaeon]